MAKKIAKKVTKEESDSKLFAFLGVLLTIIGFIIVLLARKNDKYAMHYGKQGLVLGIAGIIAWVASMILVFIPIIGWLAMMVIYLGLFVLWIIGIVQSLSGEMKVIPLIGKYGEKINL